MSIWDGVFGRRNVKLTEPGGWNINFGSASGKAVTQESALGLATAWACVRLKSRTVGTLPISVYEMMPDGSRRQAKDHWLYSLVHDTPNADQTAAEYWMGQVGCIDLWGNSFAEKVRGTGGRVVALNPMRPDQTTVYRTPSGQRQYRYSPLYGPQRVMSEDDVFHLRGFTLGGDVGLSAISYGRQTLGTAIAADEVAGKMFANGLSVSGFVEMASGTKVTREQREQLVELFQKFAGSTQAGKIMPLDPGMSFTAVGMNPDDAQLLETRAFHVEEICRWFDVLPVLIGHAAAGQTMWGSGVEQIMLGWLTLNLRPLLESIEQAIAKQLLSPADRTRYYAEFNFEGLLRADSAARAAFMSSMAQNGFLTRNEGRALDNRAPVAGGDVLTVQSNLVPLDKLGTTPPTETPPGFGLPAPKAPAPAPPVAPPPKPKKD